MRRFVVVDRACVLPPRVRESVCMFGVIACLAMYVCPVPPGEARPCAEMCRRRVCGVVPCGESPVDVCVVGGC